MAVLATAYADTATAKGHCTLGYTRRPVIGLGLAVPTKRPPYRDETPLLPMPEGSGLLEDIQRGNIPSSPPPRKHARRSTFPRRIPCVARRGRSPKRSPRSR